jgi:ATP-dependent Clp protease ATP-binding subunit ClpC
MLERFSQAGREVISLAQDEARGLSHHWIGTEHLLLGVLGEGEGIGALALTELGVTLDETRARVAAIVGPGEARPPAQIPFTPRAKKVLEGALREALALGHQFIDTEHLLLGLVRDEDCVAAQVLRDRDIGAPLVRTTVTALLDENPHAYRVRTAEWEYRILELPDGDALTVDLLAQLAAERWELMSAFGVGERLRAVFKRRA